MYSEADIEAAVAAGAMSPDAAAGLRRHVATAQASPAVDEENFRLLSGFNDIFVSVAAVLLLSAVAWIGASIGDSFPNRLEPVWSALGAGLAVTTTAWALAEFFTRRRRMALPSIILLLAFVGGVLVTAVAGGTLLVDPFPSARSDMSGNYNFFNAALRTIVGVGALIAAGAAWVHWRRFRVPITVAAGAVTVVGAAISLMLASLADPNPVLLPIIFAGGLSLFALAMWWDVSDRERVTRRSDVAFWLHLAAAPMIAHSVFNGLGVFDGAIDAGTAFGVVALYILFAIVALAIDRRALLVSSLVYVLYAMRSLFDQFGVVELNVALTGLVIGSALLLLSAFWHPIRRAVVGGLPVDARRFLPVLERAIPRPAS